VPPKPRECRARVSAVRTLQPEVVEIDLQMAEPPSLPFSAGQWVSVPFGPKTVRAYSMVSTPARAGALTLSIDVSPGGLGSRWVRELAPGQEVRFKGPTGGFVFDRADPRRPLFAAEEIGVVPIRSMLADLYETGFGRPAVLVLWARDPAWLLYDAELRTLARKYPGLTYVPVLREAPAGWRGERGELAAAVTRLIHAVDGLVAYVCGGEGTIKQVREVLVGKGMDRKSVKWEKFW
jgi:ferredoxin-NADP reductase